LYGFLLLLLMIIFIFGGWIESSKNSIYLKQKSCNIMNIFTVAFVTLLFEIVKKWTNLFSCHLVHSKNKMNELTQEKIRLFWWTSSNRRVTKAHHRTAWRPFELIKLKLCIFFFKWAIVSLDKTLIHLLELFKALWTVCSLHWNCLLDLEPFGYNWRPLYGEKCFHQKPSFLFDWRKKDMEILDDMGVSKLSATVFFFFKVKYSFNIC